MWHLVVDAFGDWSIVGQFSTATAARRALESRTGEEATVTHRWAGMQEINNRHVITKNISGWNNS